MRRAMDERAGCELRLLVIRVALVSGQPVTAPMIRSGEVDRGQCRVKMFAELECKQVREEGIASGPGLHRADATHDASFGPATIDSNGRSSELDHACTSALGQAVGDVIAELAGQRATVDRTDLEIIALLSSSSLPGVLGQAAVEAGQRQLLETAPTLRNLTSSGSNRVVLKAAAALGLLRDRQPETVAALVRLTEGSDPVRHRVAIHALADIGSQEALRYVANLAQSHPSAELREIARNRLANPMKEPEPAN